MTHDEAFASYDPSTGETVWEGKHATKKDVGTAVEQAAAAFPAWSNRSLEERITFLKRFAEVLEKKKRHLAETISIETGKPLWEALTEVAGMQAKVTVSIDAYYDRCAERTKGTSITHHKPHGVVAVLGPFNFPGHLPNGHIVPALLAGNTVVFKPSSLTPKVGEEVLKCWQEARLPQGVLNLVQGGGETGHYLAKHADVRALFFTGSYTTGKLLTKAFGDDPTKLLALEMGGNNPLVVADVADPQAAAYLTIQSAYLTAGQRCTCARRLIVVDGNEPYLKALVQMIRTIRVGRFTDTPEPFMGPVINKESMERFLAAQAQFGAQGGEPLVEMEPLKEGTSFLSPGLMDVTAVSHRPDEELFAPFLQLIRVPSFDAALEEANQTAYGLSAALFSQERTLFERFLREVEAGVINWNTQTTGASSAAPFGGIGKSGNHRPSAYYAADYCAYPVASMEYPSLKLPEQVTPGLGALHAPT